MVTNIAAYRFVEVDDTELLAADLRALAEAALLLGTVLIAHEGINLFLAGSAEGIERFVAGLRADARFSTIRIKYSQSTAQPFGRLKVKIKPEIISFRRDHPAPSAGRAPAVTPAELARWIRQGQDDRGRRLLLLDTRNRQEVVHGTFAGALTLPIDRFTELPDAVTAHRRQLEDATIVSFCTGGIRCEKAALWMQAEGLDVFQLEGGILDYFEQVGDFGYQGHCFVFDERIALDGQLQPVNAALPGPGGS
jgi:UPF0176 protein